MNNIDQFSIETVIYAERFIELLTDIIVQLPTRRFFNVLLDDINFVIQCYLTSFVKSLIKNDENMEINIIEKPLTKKIQTENGEEEQIITKTANLFNKMLNNFKFYSNFEINDTTGETLSQNDIMEKHYEKVLQLQKSIFKHFRDEMPIFPLQNIKSIDKRQVLKEEFDKLNDEQLISIASSLKPPIQINNSELLMEVLISIHEKVQSHLQVKFLFYFLLRKNKKRISKVKLLI